MGKDNFDRFLNWRKIWITHNKLWMLWNKDTNIARFKRHAICEMTRYLIKFDREINND